MTWLKHWSLAIAASIFFASCGAIVSRSPEPAVQEAVEPGTIRTELYAEVLATYVDERGLVDYEGLQANREPLDTYLADLAALDEATYNSWSEDEQIAYWVNAYNAITLMSIIDQDPIKPSIKDILGVWRVRRHAVYGGEKTLDGIEHGILRKFYDEPRVHAALVCAALSCPLLRAEPYVGELLDAQLDEQVEQWLAKSDGFRIDREGNTVYLSKIFDWFTSDWEPSYGVEEGFTGNSAQKAVLNFVSQYADEGDIDYLKAGDYEVKFFDYDWSLNVQF
ncbi:MAG: DUF547 domain-containing protein [Synechococcus sp.]